MTTTPLKTIGKVMKPRGLQGEVCIKPWDEAAPWVGRLQRVYLYTLRDVKEMHIEKSWWQGEQVIMKFRGVSSREDVEKFLGAEVKALEADLPVLEEDEFYAEDLVGLCVKSQDSGEELGVVKEVLSSEAGDFLEVVAEGLSESVLVPFQEVFVPTVDQESRIIYIVGLDSLFKGA
jgi:16S rRNA processing protein RimM